MVLAEEDSLNGDQPMQLDDDFINRAIGRDSPPANGGAGQAAPKQGTGNNVPPPTKPQPNRPPPTQPSPQAPPPASPPKPQIQ